MIPDSLLLAVAFDDGRMALPAPPPVLGIPGPPFAGAALTDLPVFRIRGDLAAVAIGAPPPLTVRFAADQLTGLKRRWLEDPLTIATPPFDHTGVVALKGSGEEFRNCYRVRTASPPMALSQQQNRWKCGRFIPVLTLPYGVARSEVTP